MSSDLAGSLNAALHNLAAREERHMLDEIAFWGIHDFQDGSYSTNCVGCGWGFREPIHTGRWEKKWEMTFGGS